MSFSLYISSIYLLESHHQPPLFYILISSISFPPSLTQIYKLNCSQMYPEIFKFYKCEALLPFRNQFAYMVGLKLNCYQTCSEIFKFYKMWSISSSAKPICLRGRTWNQCYTTTSIKRIWRWVGLPKLPWTTSSNWSPKTFLGSLREQKATQLSRLGLGLLDFN